MSACYRRLNLPKNPLKNIDAVLHRVKNAPSPFHMFNVDPFDTLTDDVLGIFDNLNLRPRAATVFHLPVPRTESQSLMHTDILRVGDQWKFITCGVNWELNDIAAQLSWWDTDRPELYPTDSKFFWLDPHGIHYSSRFKQGIDASTDRRIDSVNTLDHPLLVRTNIPHNVYLPDQDFQDTVRCSISIRFENDFPTWEDAVDCFRPVTL